VRRGVAILGAVLCFGMAEAQQDDDAKQRDAAARAMVAAGRDALWSASTWPLARQHFTAALAVPKTWWGPSAQIGLATLARLEGRLPEALDRLATARRTMSRWPLADELPRLTRFDLQVEASRCYLALGLGDRAGAELDAATEFAGPPGLARRIALDLARIDLHLARDEARLARRVVGVVQSQLDQDPGSEAERALRAAQRRELAFRDGMVRLRLAHEPEEIAELAAALKAGFLAAEVGSQARARLGADAVAALARADDLATALAVSRELCQPPFESVQREAEAKALYVGLLLRASGDRSELAAAYADLQRVATALFDAWRALPLRPGGVGTFRYVARLEVLGALLGADRALAPDQPLRALQHLESALALGTLSRRLHPQPLLATADGWAPDQGALAFAFTPGVVHWLAVDAQGLGHFAVPLDATTSERLAELLHSVDHPPLGELAAERAAADTLAREIAARLWPEPLVARLSGWRSVLLVGDESHIAALQALPLAGVPLGVAKAVTHVPSLSLLAGLRQRAAARPPRPAAGPELVLFADPAVDAAATAAWQIDALNLTTDQLTALCADLPAPRVQRLLHQAATAAALRSAAVADAAQLTILAHGVEDLRAERAAAIAVASPLPSAAGGVGDPALLRCEAVEALRVPPLVALGVCGAASGPRRLGDDGAHHLGGAFLLAGADRVVLAGGQLAVGATVALLAEFTAKVRTGSGAAAALRAARAAVRATPGREHPYFWAGLRQLGLPDATPGAAWR
jgi:hypothetical protein